jgi:hypothetical protein
LFRTRARLSAGRVRQVGKLTVRAEEAAAARDALNKERQALGEQVGLL